MQISRDQRILVTGGTGVLGSYIVKQLLSEGFTNIEVFSRSGITKDIIISENPAVRITKGDITEIYPLEDSVKEAEFIIHAAAIVSFNPSMFKRMYQVNVEGTANLVNMALLYKKHRLIHISSIAALGRSEKMRPISESTVWSNSNYNSYYGITKYLSEQEVWRAYHEGLPISILNPSLILGDGDWDQSSLQIFKRTYNGLPFYPIGSTGIVDVRDVADLVIKLLQSDIQGERFIVSGGNISYKDLFTQMAKGMHKNPPKRPASPWLLSFIWRLEKLRCIVSGKSPIITRESAKSTAHNSVYDNSKSLKIEGFEYHPIMETISKYSKVYSEYRSLDKNS